MAHSIAAKYAARPAARFPSPSPLARERRLGLRAGAAFRPAPARPTVLRDPLPSALTRLRAGARSLVTAPRVTRSLRSIGPDAPTWAAASRAPRPSAGPAPWRA